MKTFLLILLLCCSTTFAMSTQAEENLKKLESYRDNSKESIEFLKSLIKKRETLPVDLVHYLTRICKIYLHNGDIDNYCFYFFRLESICNGNEACFQELKKYYSDSLIYKFIVN